MLILVAKFAILALVVIVAGSFLARYADQLGESTGMGRSLAGWVLLAGATSLPELAVGCHAAVISAGDLAVGDMLGSSLFNLLILAILDLLSRTGGRMLSRTAAAHALSAIGSIVLTVIVLLFLLVDTGWTLLRVGPGSFCIVLGYLFCLRLIYIDQQMIRAETEQLEMVGPRKRFSLRPLIGYLAAAAVILVTAPYLVFVADELADVTGLGGTIIGTVLMALVTSLPEGVTTLAAIRMGAVEMAIGNVLGSNSFNMVALVGVDLFFDGSLLEAVSGTHAVTAGAVILVTCVVTLGMLYRAEKRIWFIEPDAVLVILLIVASLGLVSYLGG